MKKNLRYLLPLLIAIVFVLIPSDTAKAAQTITGTLSVSFSPTSGVFSSLYDGDLSLSGGEVYTWYKDGTAVSNSRNYTPNAAGSYYCTLKDSNYYDGMLTSKTITLYRATGMNVTFDNAYGLYEPGSTVTATAYVTDGQVVSNWKTSVAGVVIPATGSVVSFAMPAQNITITVTIKAVVQITVSGGTADKYTAYQGETVTLVASDIGHGRQFLSWTATGGRLSDPNSPTTTLTIGTTNIVVTANFSGSTTTADNNSYNNANNYMNNGTADAINTVYTVLDNQGYNVQFYHHTQGPLCDAAFRYAQGYDWLVIDYFNLTLNNSFSTYETAYPLKIQVTIPADLVKQGRNWRMVCVSRNGQIYSFPDEDANDSTITFSPNRFYAYAMCYNDIQPSTEEEIIVEEQPVQEPVKQEVVTAPSSSIHSASESKTASSSIHSADASVTTGGAGIATPAASNSSKLKSDQKSAVERADGANIPLISM